MEAAHTSETSVDNYITRQYIPEDKSELYKTMATMNSWGCNPCCNSCAAWNLYSHNFSALSFDEHSSQTNTSYAPEILLPALLHASRTAVTDFEAKNEHVLLVRTSYSLLRSFCVTGLSSGLATGMTWLDCRGEESITRGLQPLLISFFDRSARLLLGFVMHGTSCIINFIVERQYFNETSP
jgi:hypothetical protein